MRGYKFHVTPTSKPGVVAIRPTGGTILKSFLTPIVVAGLSLAALHLLEERDLKNLPDLEMNPDFKS